MNIHDFIQQSDLLLDVRSPIEFLEGHIPGAISFPLFSDEERRQVGTVYKQQGKEIAVKLGLRIVGPKLLSFVEKAEELAGSSKNIRLYCARGGMRSSFVAWLLGLAGFKCIVLKEGYKAFRRWALCQFNEKYSFFVIGGFTGSGKTDLLYQLQSQGEQILDLEEIANHRGSSFGHLGCLPQPSNEHFENLLAWNLSKRDKKRPIWIEDESRTTGSCYLPLGIWDLMTQAPFLWIEKSKEDRLKQILEQYGRFSVEDLSLAAKRLVKKLGAVRTQEIVGWIQNRELANAFSALLEYYDKTYTYSLQKRQRTRIDFPCTGSDLQLLGELMRFAQTGQKESRN